VLFKKNFSDKPFAPLFLEYFHDLILLLSYIFKDPDVSGGTISPSVYICSHIYTVHSHTNPVADAYIKAKNAHLMCIFILNIGISLILAPTWAGLSRNSSENRQFFALFMGESCTMYT